MRFQGDDMNPERLWYGTDPLSSAARVALSPFSWLYGAAASANGWWQERSRSGARAALPALSIGNLSVGGTGKTPMAAWAAARLMAGGGRPSIVMRGYGDDEPLVHAILNPAVPVVVDADRSRGIVRAKAGGADCVILDDAFQHRRAPRVEDWVLISAEQWLASRRVLPAGPMRESATALARATVVIITRKSATREQATAVADAVRRHVSPDRIAHAHFALDGLRAMDGEGEAPLSVLSGRRVVAVAGIGAPEAFFAQLRQAGASVTERPFPDHHAFDASDITRLVRDVAQADALVCTLKDAVKLAPRWTPATVPAWYVSQHLRIERGSEVLDRGLEAVLAARHAVSQPPASPA
jgi:tetraacyldisaccharide 4'-kinase